LLDISELLDQIKESPYEELEITAPHTGVVRFSEVSPGDKVYGPSGVWKEKLGDPLAIIVRERNEKSIRSPQKATVADVYHQLEGCFVEAGTPLLKLRHFLSKDEVVDVILKQALSLFNAPERAQYYFIPDVEKKIKTSGLKSVTVHPGMELCIMSRMKRETTLPYSGPNGVIYAAYFRPGENIDAGAPLVGVCPPDQLPLIQDVIFRVQTEWEELE
jgi:biotin carboxyl carrier protein